jgi:predicted RecA/RadA family phage recombinase
MATPKIQPGDSLPYTAPAGGVTEGVGYWMNGLFGVANITAAAGARYQHQTDDVFPLTKLAGFAITEGALCYWDDINKRVAGYVPGYLPIGHCADNGGVAAAATTVRVRLQQSPTAGGGGGILPVLLADPGNGLAIPVTEIDGICLLTLAAPGETRTLAAPAWLGQKLQIGVDVLAGGGTVVTTCATGLDTAPGNTNIGMIAAGAFIKLEATRVAGNLRWRHVGFLNCNLT